MLLIRRHAEFEGDPEAFANEWKAKENHLAQRLQKAAVDYPKVTFSDDIMEFAAGLCEQFKVDGYRGDLTMIRTARAAAAFDGRLSVTREDVLLAARFVLPHRLKKMPFEDMGMTDRMLDAAASEIKKVQDRKVHENEAESTTGREDRQVREFGEFLKSRDIPVTLIDAGTGRKTAKRRAVQLAAVLHASYQPMEGLRIDPE